MTCSGSTCCSDPHVKEKVTTEFNAKRSVIEDNECQIGLLDEEANTSTLHVVVRLTVHGMDCAGCANDVSRTLLQIHGVVKHTINLAMSEVEVEYEPCQVAIDQIKNALCSSGYTCEERLNGHEATLQALSKVQDREDSKRRFIASLSCSAPLIILSWIGNFASQYRQLLIYHGIFLSDLIEVALASGLIYICRRFFVVSFAAARQRALSLELLIVCGISTAYVYSTAAMALSIWTSGCTRPETMFEAIGELASVTMFGRWLESTLSCQATSAVSSLLQLLPETATRTFNGQEECVSSSGLLAGDQIIVRPGCTVPADCLIIVGTSGIDESSFSGDIVPIMKREGDLVYAGTINRTSVLSCQVIRNGQETRLSGIVRLLVDAQSGRANVQLIADRLALYLVRTVLILSLVTLLAWLYLDPTKYAPQLGEDTGRVLLSMKLAIAVLVITCPCALSVATPTAVVVGTGVAAEHGILVKGAPVLETLVSVTDIVFDKTGTLTRGVMSVHDTKWYNREMIDTQEAELWHILATAEVMLGSLHPVSLAITEYASRIHSWTTKSLHVLEDLQNMAGQGFSCSCLLRNRHKRLVVGPPSLLESLGILLNRPEINHDGSLIHVAIDGRVTCTILFEDSVRPEAAATMEHLRNMNKTIWMLTGDRPQAAQAVAKQVGIVDCNVVSTATPESKAEVIRELQRQGRTVAFCGDGVNDVLALTTADVGISMCGSTDAAMASADVILDGSSRLHKVVTAMLLAQDVLKRIKFNLYSAMIWNLVMVPCAMGIFLPWHIFLPPVFACMAMSMSCISIIGSSLALKNWNVPDLDGTRDDSSINEPDLGILLSTLR